jgi:hypothetical protein
VKAKAAFADLFGRSGGRRNGSVAFTWPTRPSRGDGSRVPSRTRRSGITLVALLAMLCGLVLMAATASADTEFGEEGQSSGILTSPEGIGIDQGTGDVYVGGGFAHRVAKFEADGTPLFAWGYGIEDGAEELETCTTNCLAGYYMPFEPHSVFGPMIDEGGAVAVDPTGEHDIYVLDYGHSRIDKFTPDGEFLFSFGGDTVAYGPDNSSNNGVQILKILATGGTYKLRVEYAFARAYNGGFGGNTETGTLSANATATEIEAALNNLSTVNGAGVSGGHISVAETGTREFTLTFEGNLGGDFVPAVQPSYGNPPIEPTLTGGEEKAEVVVTNPGGAGEVCETSNGDTCKYGGLGTTNGMFKDGEHFEGRFFSSFPGQAPIIAVDSTGTVYVGDNQRIQEFNPEGQYIGQINLPTPSEHWNFTKALAIDGSGNIFVISEVISKQEELEHPSSYKREISGVQEFDSSGTLIRTLETAPSSKPVKPTSLAIDENGDVFVGETVNNPGEPIYTYEFAAYKPDGTHYAQFGSTSIKSSCHEYLSVPGTAIGFTAHKLYVSNSAFSCTPAHHVVVISLAEVAEPGEPIVEEETTSNIQPTTASLHAVVNPKGNDTHYHFEYVDQASYEAEGGFASSHTKSTASTDLGLVIQRDPVQVSISELKPGTVYHWRAVAESSAGTVYGADESFEALTPVSVRNLTTQTVESELVTLKAELNPNGQASNYRFKLGEDTGYGMEQEGTLEIGNEFVPVEVTFTNLKPSTTYHYQLVAENGYDEQYGGPYETADQMFTTEQSVAEERSAEECPNTNLREENSSLKLADCRAYEQITPTEKFGGEAFPYLGYSPSGERALWYSEGAFAGATGNQLFIPYISQRSSSGWTTQAMVQRPLPPPIEPLLSGLNFSPEMDRWLYYQSEGLNAEEASYEQSSVFLSEGFSDGSVIVHATPVISLVEGNPTEVYVFASVTAAANDFSRYYIVTNRRLLQSDPRPDEDFGGGSGHGSRIYEVAGVGGPNPTLRLVTEVPLGLSGAGGFGGAGCELNNENTLELQDPRMTSTDGNVLAFTGPVEEQAGEPCGEGQPNPVGVLVRVGETLNQVNVPLPAQCSGGHPCASAPTTMGHYLGMSEDGSLVWFATEQPLINSDGDERHTGMTAKDIYVAKINPSTGQVEELVQASAGEATATHPTPGEGADVGETGVTEESGAKQSGASIISADGSHGAFESPAVLTEEANGLGQSAVKGANNLYDYDVNSNKLKFVAELCSGPEMSGSEYSKYTEHHNHKLEIGLTAVKDPACPSTLSPWMQTIFATGESDDGLWLEWGGRGLARMTPDGRYMIFLSWSRLTPDDTDNVLDLYRYDFETGDLERLSFGRNGNDGNGNDDRFPITNFNENGGFSGNSLAENGGRNISADGKVVIFQTAAPLVGYDNNTGPEPGECGGVEGTGCDIYEWEEQGHGTCTEAGGCVRLVSDGAAYHGSAHGVISSSGQNIAFGTSRGLAPNDTNGTGDLYDARADGGIHAVHPPEPCRSAESCRPEREAEPTPPHFGSQEFNGPGNSALHLRCAHGKVRVIRHNQVRCVSKRHRSHRRRHRHRHRHRGHRRHGRAGANLGGAK